MKPSKKVFAEVTSLFYHINSLWLSHIYDNMLKVVNTVCGFENNSIT
jgi:hypothetical protein